MKFLFLLPATDVYLVKNTGMEKLSKFSFRLLMSVLNSNQFTISIT